MEANTPRTTVSQSLSCAVIDEQMLHGLVPHGNSDWSLWTLLRVALAWALGEHAELGQRFHAALAVARQERWTRIGGQTYQGFLKALVRWTPELRQRLARRLRQTMQGLFQPAHGRENWQVFAVDGTRISAPRTKANERAFGPRRCRPTKERRHSRKAYLPAGPQVWLTVLWQMGLGLAWDWRHGVTGSNEREHLLDMLDDLPERSLLVGDAGFQGFRYWSELQRRKLAFVIRVGQNVRLIRQLGLFRQRAGIVCLWPDEAQRRCQPPVLMRLLKFQSGRHPVYVVTNVLDKQALSDRAVGELYRQRWGVELFLRTFKQTFGRGRLRSHAPTNALVELDWSLLALWCVQPQGVLELISRGHSPTDLSAAKVLRIARAQISSVENSGQVAKAELRKQDGYHRRRKVIRRWPSQKPYEAAGRPRFRAASPLERFILKELRRLRG
jgi:hypothetical protein